VKAICGTFQLDGQPANPRDVAAMRAALVGRGVAEEQAWHVGPAALSGVTWWPVDDGVSDPPLYAHPESGCTIVADALLFERGELLAALDLQPSRLQGIGDAELILRAYLRWGEDCAVRLYGDFAFVIHDPRNASVYAARDGVGVRPMYFHHASGKLFAFASNASAVIASSQVPGDLNEMRIADFLTDGECNGVRSTFYCAVLRLPPAHWCRVDARGYRETCYWMPGNWQPPALPVTDEAWTEDIGEALRRAVRQHVVGARGIGSMLSGGLDSSTIAAMAADLLAAEGKGPLQTFSAINTADPNCAETRAVRAMLARSGFAPHFADAARLDMLAPELAASVAACEEPFDNHMVLLQTQWILAARAGVGATLDGIDADNLFSAGGRMMRLFQGGHWITAFREARGLQLIYGPHWSVWRQIAEVIPGAFVPELLKGSVRALRQRRNWRKSVRESITAPEFARRIIHTVPVSRAEDLADVKAGRQVRERCSGIRSASLTAGIERYRRVAAGHGIEPRHPFLDRRFIELCMHLPDRQRSRDGWTKSVLREVARPLLPEDVTWRRGKEHLGSKFSQTLFDNEHAIGLESLSRGRSILAPWVDMRRLAPLIERYRRDGRPDEFSIAFDAALLRTWLMRQGNAV
jgi:asparagine synthase (glutamine-hydrolysing)